MIQVVHDCNPANAGDMASVPTKYVQFGPTVTRHILDGTGIDPAIPTIIGGGGLLCHRGELERILRGAIAPVIGWGIGLNAEGMALADAVPQWCDRFTTLGMRDVGTGQRWVPCASCMHPAFDQPATATQPVVAYLGMPFDTKGRPWMHCCGGQSAEAAIRFIASGEIVVTSSYHGLYWGVLLGRRVVCIPNRASSKFYRFPFPVPMASPDNWEQRLWEAVAYPSALTHCRAETCRFRDEVGLILDVWRGDAAQGLCQPP